MSLVLLAYVSHHIVCAKFTWCSQGIGAAIAIALAREGADVIINYVSASSKTRAEEVVKEVEGFGSRSLLVQANLESLEEVEALVQAGVTKFGKIDILVNNGGVSDMQSVDQIVSSSGSLPCDTHLWVYLDARKLFSTV